MKKSLLVGALLGALLLAGCTTDTITCPEGTEYRESHYENGNIRAKGCFEIDSDVMEGHWIYYFENGGKDSEGDISNNLRQGTWKYYDEDGNNTLVMKGNYKDDLEDGEWKYYDGERNYICSDIFAQGELTDEGNCERYDEEE